MTLPYGSLVYSSRVNSAALANNQIAYIDMDRILNTSKVGKKAVTNLEENHKVDAAE